MDNFSAITRAAAQARRAEDNSPAIHRWGTEAGKPEESHQGRKKVLGLTLAFFRPVGAWCRFGLDVPPLKRWAIVGRPCGTLLFDYA